MLGECGVLCVGSVVCCVRAAVYCFAPYMCVYVSVWSWVCLCVGVVMGVYMCLHIHCTHPGHGCMRLETGLTIRILRYLSNIYEDIPN